MHEQYRSRFLEEVHRGVFREQEIRMAKEPQNSITEVALSESSNSAFWNNWSTFIEQVNYFNLSQSHFILVVDVMSKEDLENFTILSAVPWKMVLDFNPSSEDDGFHQSYLSQSTLQLLVSPWTPGQIKDISSLQLPKQVDKHRTQWLFVNGRKQDIEGSGPKDLPGWEQYSKKQISRFFACCSDDDKFDHQKSMNCILLPISKTSIPYVDITLRRLEENFEEFPFNFFCFDQTSYQALPWIQEKLVEFPLTSLQVKHGVEAVFHLSTEALNYRMPTSQAGVSMSLTPRTYAYLSEYFQLLYEDCENEFINLECDEEERDKIEEEHRRSFLSGNLISPASLYFNHDAKRLIEDEIQVHIERMLCQPLKHSVIVEIMHSPGTGGSTIARRVLWNLHKSFPCVVIKLPVQSDFEELDPTLFIRNLCERISTLEDECGIPVLVLVDDIHHWRLLGVSNRIVRTLNAGGKRSIVLVCLHNTEMGKQTSQSVHKVFTVDSRLEATPADLNGFRSKYKEYMESEKAARRVFHFPLMSMIHEFRPRLRSIVFSTLKELDDLEKDVAAFVAFLQIYAGQSTPAVLLYEAFKFQFEITDIKPVTYDTIKKRFTDHLLNLMVRENPRTRGDSPSECLERYTLQHIEVAKLVFQRHLDRTKQTLFVYVDTFLDHKVMRLDKFLSLYCDLLLYHKGGNRGLRFSLLFDSLNNSNDERKAAQLFCKAAEKVADPRVYGNAARFFAKMGKPNFAKAKELVTEGLKISKTKGRTQSIQDSKGVILCIELKIQVNRNKIQTIDELQQLAEAAISAFKEARDFPPTFHSPLIGEVEVWLLCIDWIVKNCCKSDEEKAVKFLTTAAPPFFRTCVSDCYTLLDRVDDIIRSSTTLPDPEKAQEHSQRVRLSLIKTTRPKGNKLQNSRRLIKDICKTLMSGNTLSPISEKQVKRFRVWTLLSLVRDQQADKQEDLQYLVQLLEEMVLIEKDASFARHFLRMCPQISGRRSCDLEKAMKISNVWMVAEEYDPFPYFYCMVISFMQIINGHGPAGYYGIYQEMLRKLREKSRHHCKRTEATHFLGRNTDGMSQLVSRAVLFTGRDYRANDSEAVANFWTMESRQKLKECVGRVRVKVEGKSEVTTVELLQGGVELHVKKNSGIGKPGKDFDKDTKVYFVVSFNLGGPVANGIKFNPFQEKTK